MIDPNTILPIGHVDDEELEILLGSSFPRGRSRVDGMDHMDESETIVLQVFYDKNSRIERVVAGPGWSDEFARRLEVRVGKNFRVQPTLRVRRCIVFFLQPVTGWWRYKDIFQLMPVPSNAPKPDQAYALHPAVIEIKYLDADETMIQHLRVRRALYKVQLMLATITKSGMSWQLDGVGMEKKWVFTKIADSAIQSDYLQPGYDISGFVAVQDDFSSTVGMSEIERVDSQAYYKGQGVEMIDFRLPSDADMYFDLFFALKEPEQSRFLRAMYWYHISGRSFEISKSLAYVSTINAIEAMQAEQPKVICPVCKKDRAPSPTAHFRNFLEKYAPGEDTKSDRNDLYNLRSKLVHGAQLMKEDLPTPWGSLRPSHLSEWGKRSYASSVVRVALLNWLNSHKQ